MKAERTALPETDEPALRRAYQTVRSRLLAEQHPDGFWLGELCGSALSTATAVSALALAEGKRAADLTAGGVRWLARHQNADGGWGDTPESPSNISTSLLAEAALRLAGGAPGECLRAAERHLTEKAGPTARERARALADFYGADRTFAAPILANVALADEACGRPAGSDLGVEWGMVPALPFELSCCPRSWFPRLRLHVVSYALPALIAIGRLVHSRRPTRVLPLRALRAVATGTAMRCLEAIQPESGGFLEAVPLTSFVVMSLAACGAGDHPAVRRGVEFIRQSGRADGCWPIDSNLSVWLTTMAVSALCAGGRPPGAEGEKALRWLLAQQHSGEHPYTGAPAGGWAWTHLSGGVPDADDTSGALLALAGLHEEGVAQKARAGLRWLLGLQNSDGGWPTFCRGWGRLPFDRSAPDLTAHALRALIAWPSAGLDFGGPVRRGLDYLGRAQREDGAWLPLWFGNQHSPEQQNPVYGTSRVLAAYAAAGLCEEAQAKRGVSYLLAAQNADGGWGGAAGVPSSVEETAVAVEALARCACSDSGSALRRGASYLAARVAEGTLDRPTPIGLYFAKLWYSEKLYPTIWTVAALGSVVDGMS